MRLRQHPSGHDPEVRFHVQYAVPDAALFSSGDAGEKGITGSAVIVQVRALGLG
jgi:hypothetical protein